MYYIVRQALAFQCCLADLDGSLEGNMEKRYRALRIISTVYKILGTIVLVIAVLSAAGLCLMGVLGGSVFQSMRSDLPAEVAGMGMFGSAIGGVIIGIVSLIGGGLSGLSLFAMGEGISLAIAIEENTRATTMYLAAQHQPPSATYPPQ
jgi:hypothetical protein